MTQEPFDRLQLATVLKPLYPKEPVEGPVVCLFCCYRRNCNFFNFRKDLNVLSDILYTAFLAQQGSAMCNLPRLPLSDEDRIAFIKAHNYANWLKQHI